MFWIRKTIRYKNRSMSKLCKHIDYICQNVTSKISLLSKIKQYLPLETRQLYYNAYIFSVLDYCLTVWGSTSKYQLDRLLKLQKRAARIILDMLPDAQSMPLFQQLGWLTIYERLKYNKAIVLYKSTNGLTPSYISDLFEFPLLKDIMSGPFQITTC